MKLHCVNIKRCYYRLCCAGDLRTASQSKPLQTIPLHEFIFNEQAKKQEKKFIGRGWQTTNLKTRPTGLPDATNVLYFYQVQSMGKYLDQLYNMVK